MRRGRVWWSRGLGVALLVPLLLWLGGCWPFNAAPIASFTVSAVVIEEGGTIQFSAILSSDEDGVIVDFDWDYGDGTDGTGRSVSHTYTTAGTFTVILRVTDNDGETGTTQRDVYVEAGEPPGPAASFTVSPASGASPLSVRFDASASTYDQTPLTFTWEFGDGATGFGQTTSHLYVSSTGRSYTATLTVRAPDGRVGTATRAVTVSGAGGTTSPTGSPSARFDIDFPDTNDDVAPVRVELDPEDSEAATGRTLAMFAGSFGDGKAASSIASDIQMHTFSTDSSSEVFSVTLVVIDDEGATDDITKTVRAKNYLPTAGFEVADDWDYLNAAAVVAWWTGDEDTDDDDDRITYRNVPLGDRTVWIRSQEIVDADWLNMNGADPVPNGSGDEPAEFNDDNEPNMCFDPEGQTWAGGVLPAWFTNRSWGIKVIRIDWGDLTSDDVFFEDAADTTASHVYDFSAGGVQSWTITVTAVDYLGGEDSVERTITMNEG
ncbi:MAG: PKD domain-containing protein [Candidatus Bipolaricaulia bacterium]